MDISQILGNIGFDWPVALANLVNFLIIYYLLKRYAFGPIKETLASRRAKIEQGVENARRAETELLMAKQEYERHVADGKAEANEIIAHARVQEEAIIAKAAREAAQEVVHVKREAEVAIAKERAHMETEVRIKAADLVVAGVEKLLREKMDDASREAFIERGIEALKAHEPAI